MAATAKEVTPTISPSSDLVSRYAPEESRKGADIIVEALEREGVKHVFAYPGEASVEIHQALTRSNVIRNVLPRHEQGGVFAAEGYARSSGLPGVCIATSGPGATNLVSGLADAMIDSIPLVAITGQVPRRMIGTDAFQETPIVEVTRSITKHNYLVLDIDDIPRIVSEAFFLATSGRPGPVLIDVPKDIQEQLAVPNWNQPFRLSGYMSRLPKEPSEAHLEQIVRLIFESKKPVLYVGGGCLNSGEELKRFAELTGIPVTCTLMGLGSFPTSDPLSLQMLGMYGTVYANYAVDKSDLLLSFGVRFDDHVTGKLEAFASRAKIVHIDVDSAEIGKNKQPHVSVHSDVKLALKGINRTLESKGAKLELDYTAWWEELIEQKVKYPLTYKTFGEAIPPQYAVQLLYELTDGNVIISTGVGQHQMWAAQFYKYKRPRQWLTSGGFGAMGFGLPAAIGAAVANPGAVVVDIDGDGSFMMNVQELATIRVENLPIKILLLNNQHLGMVVQWEDRFCKANRADSYLGNPSNKSEVFPNMLKFAEACEIPAARITKKEDLREAICKMLETSGPYFLDVIIPHQEHVLPIIPTGGTFKDVITEVPVSKSLFYAYPDMVYFHGYLFGCPWKDCMEKLVLLFGAVDVLMRGSLLGEGDEASPLLRAPFVASFSSRGPNPGSGSLLKWLHTLVKSHAGFKGDTRHYQICNCDHSKPMNWTVNNDAEFAYGASHLNLATTENPGLVYDFDKMSCTISMPWRPHLVGTKSINGSSMLPRFGYDAPTDPSVQPQHEKRQTVNCRCFQAKSPQYRSSIYVQCYTIKALKGLQITVKSTSLLFTYPLQNRSSKASKFVFHIKEEFIAKLPLTMAATTANTSLLKPSPLASSSKSSIPISKSVLHFRTIPRKLTPPRSLSVSSSLSQSNSTPGSTASAVTPTKAPTHDFISRYAPDEPRKGADILVEALEREGVKDVFAYPGGASLEIHQALTRSKLIRNVLPRHEQGGVFAAEGYARSSGLPGVCIATSGPGATNLVSGLADAMIDSIPLVAITGQVPRRMIGTDAFQETPIVEVTRSITKHNYLVLDIDDIPRIVSEAFFLATSGRPGPVLIDVPKDIQQQLAVPNWNQPLRLSGYMSRLPKEPNESLLEQIKRFVELTGIPVTTTLMGLGSFPSPDPLSLQMLGMHGTVYANYAVDNSDLLLAFGVRFDDRVTGKLEAFASRAKIVHIDIDSAEIGKNKQPHVSVCSDVKLALKGINKILESKGAKVKLDYSAWRNELNEQKVKYPLNYKTFGEAIPPQYAIEVLDELTDGNAIISTGVGQHQMWAAQFYKYKKPRQWLTSGGLGAMGFGLPAAIGAAVANPGSVVVDIDGDGSFMMNVQELATIRVENLPIKILLLNNQHLGMVVQWEDRFYKANRAHTYLGNPSDESDIFPNMLKFAEACGIPAARVTKKEDLRQAIQKMLETPGPYLLDVIVPHQEHVLPMIPGGGAFKDVITDGDGRTKY
ncbi:hypothetical protein GOBAR_DD15781 [Gossypium barbadense]|nr:hypothetical protein GOBAR_DD15781 [Gossypium barbadense]